MKRLAAILLSMIMIIAMVPAVAMAEEKSIPIDEDHFPDAGFRGYVSDMFDFWDDEGQDGVLTPEELAAVDTINIDGSRDRKTLDSDLTLNSDGFTLNWDKIEGRGVYYQICVECYTNDSDDTYTLIDDWDGEKHRSETSVTLKWSDFGIKGQDVYHMYVMGDAYDRHDDLIANIPSTSYDIYNQEIENKYIAQFTDLEDLTGIEYFENLEYLNVEGNKIENLNLSKNINLECLEVDGNKIKNLDLSENKNLDRISVADNGMLTLNLPCEPINLLDLDDDEDTEEIDSQMNYRFLKGNPDLVISVNGEENFVNRLVKIDDQFPDKALASTIKEWHDIDGDGYLSYAEIEELEYFDYEPIADDVPEFEIADSNLNGNTLNVKFDSVKGATSYYVELKLYDRGRLEDSTDRVQKLNTFTFNLAKVFEDFNINHYDKIYIYCEATNSNYDTIGRTSRYAIDLENGEVSFVKSPVEKIKSLEGLEIFTNLEELWLENNEIEKADLSCFSNLNYVRIYNNGLKVLNLPKLPQEMDAAEVRIGNDDLKLYVNDDELNETPIEGPTLKSAYVWDGPSVTYNGKYYKGSLFYDFPEEHVTVENNGNHKNAGFYEVIVKADPGYYFEGGDYNSYCYYVINRASQKPVVSTAGKTVKYSSVKKKATATTAVKVTGAKTTKSYYKVKGSSKLTINRKTGKITVKKGTKKGSYPIYVKVKCASGTNYLAKTSATKKITVRVK